MRNEFTGEEEKRRTVEQNRCLHQYIACLANEMAKGGLDMRTAIQIPITPTPENVKATLVHAVMKSLYPDKESTSDLTTKEIHQVYESTNQATAIRFGISLDWPDRFNGGKCA